jgi:hypothetical protein
MRWASIFIFAVAASAAAEAQTPAPDYTRFHESVFLRYLNADGTQLDGTPHIGLSFGGPVLRATLDSGSTGIVVAANSIPGLDQLTSLGDGRLTYSSSGRVMIGQWVQTPVSIVGADGTQVQTEPMPVLAATNVDCLQNARDCTPSDDPRHIAMVGIGFAREHDRQPDSTPEKNPLLRTVSGGNDIRHGYILTSEGVHVGLTAANTEGKFDFVKLERQQDLRDWSAVPACISFNGQMPAACGTMLVDTGVSSMFMTVPPAQAAGATDALPPGTHVSVSVGTPASNAELYSFDAGDGNSPLAPDSIHLRVSKERVFVNTSYHLLNGFDFLYDADGGYAGFRRR